MKNFLLTSLIIVGVAHCGAFLKVWQLPYLENHISYQDVARKVDKVFNINETQNALRVKREKMRKEHEKLAKQPKPAPEPPVSKSYHGSSVRVGRSVGH